MNKRILTILTIAVLLLTMTLIQPSSAAAQAVNVTVTVTVLDSQGNPLANVPVAYKGPYYVSFGTTNASGVATKDLPSGTYTFKATYQNTFAEQTQDVGANPNLTFYTSMSQAQVYKSDSSAFSGVHVLFSPSGGFGNYVSVFTDASGLAKTELFPGTIYYKAITNNTSAVQSATLAGDGKTAGQSSLVTFYTSKSIAKVQNCDGFALAGAAINFFGGGYPGAWASATTDVNGFASVEEFPGTWTIRARLNNTSQDQGQALPGDGMTPGQSATTIFTPTKVSFTGIGPVHYWIGYWQTFTSPSYMFPATLKFRFGGVGGNEVDVAISGCKMDNTATLIKLIDHNGNGLPGATAAWYRTSSPAAWVALPGSTDANGNLFALVGSTAPNIRLTYNGTQGWKQQNLLTNPNVVFQTGSVVSDSGTATHWYSTVTPAQWVPFVQGVELLPGAPKFKWSDGTPQANLPIVAGVVNHIH